MNGEHLEQNQCVLVQQNSIIIAIYVNDFLLLDLELEEIDQLKKRFTDRFYIKNMKAISWYLGIKITKDGVNKILLIDQTTFINQIIKNLGIEECKSTKIPMDFGTKMVKSQYKS